MIGLFLRSFCRQIKKNRAVTALLLIGVIIAMFCVSTAQGLALRMYEYISGWTEYATITTVLEDYTEDFSAIPGWIDSAYGEEAVNTLFLTRQGDEVVIGWKGTEFSRWFPLSSGRFFAEQEAYKNLIVLQEAYANTMLDQRTVDLNGQAFSIVGTGSFYTYHFKLGVASAASASVFQSSDDHIVIIPYGTFLKQYEPDLMLVQFEKMTQKDAQARVQEIENGIAGSTAYMPNANSDSVLSSEQIRRGMESLVLCLIAGITILQLMRTWVEFLKREIFVYRICGMRQHRCLILVYGQWLVLLLIGSGIAVGLHLVSFPLLHYFEADRLPHGATYALMVALLFVLSVAVSVPIVKRAMGFHGRGR